MSQVAVGPQVSQIWTGNGPVLLANQDLVNSVTVGDNQSVSVGVQSADLIPPLGSIAYVGGKSLFAIAPSGTAALLVIAGGTSWAPSPAQVALQISTLGLARDTTVQGVQTVLGSPAQDGTVSSLSAPGHTIAQENQTLGVPPAVPSLKSASTTRQGATSGNTFLNFANAGRVWGLDLSYALQSFPPYSGSPSDQFIARVQTGSGLTLAVVELGVSNQNQTLNGQSTQGFNGLPLNAGDSLILNVNNGNTVTGTSQRGSVTALYSIP